MSAAQGDAPEILEKELRDLIDIRLVQRDHARFEDVESEPPSTPAAATSLAPATHPAAECPSEPAEAAAAAPSPACATDAPSSENGGAGGPPSYNKRASVLRQLEYYFSDENLARDSFMREQIDAGPDGCVSP